MSIFLTELYILAKFCLNKSHSIEESIEFWERVFESKNEQTINKISVKWISWYYVMSNLRALHHYYWFTTHPHLTKDRNNYRYTENQNESLINIMTANSTFPNPRIPNLSPYGPKLMINRESDIRIGTVVLYFDWLWLIFFLHQVWKVVYRVSKYKNTKS